MGDTSNLTIVIDSSKICGDSIDVSFYLISTGGIYRWESLPFQGGVMETVRRYHVGLAVLSRKAKPYPHLSSPILTT